MKPRYVLKQYAYKRTGRDSVSLLRLPFDFCLNKSMDKRILPMMIDNHPQAQQSPGAMDKTVSSCSSMLHTYPVRPFVIFTDVPKQVLNLRKCHREAV